GDRAGRDPDLPRLRRGQVLDQLRGVLVLYQPRWAAAAPAGRLAVLGLDLRPLEEIDVLADLQARVHLTEGDASDEAALHVHLGDRVLAEDTADPVHEADAERRVDSTGDVLVVDHARHGLQSVFHGLVVEREITVEELRVVVLPGLARVDVLEPVGKGPRVIPALSSDRPRVLAHGLVLLRDGHELGPGLRDLEAVLLKGRGLLPNHPFGGRLRVAPAAFVV